MEGRGRFQFDRSQLRITRGALILLALELGLSLVFLFANQATQAGFADYVAATGSNVFEHGRVWTLVTSAFLEIDFLGLIMHAVMLWMFLPTLERFWGTPRFYRFAAITSIAGGVVGTLVGFLLGGAHAGVAVLSLNQFIFAAIVAYGIVYAKQPVRLFGALPLTGRQLMWGFVAFEALFVGLQQKWEEGAALAAAGVAAAILCGKKTNPVLAYRRWKAKRARAKLAVIQGGLPPKKKSDEQHWLN